MTDLPVVSNSLSPAAAVATRPSANSAQRDARPQAEDSPFQAVLAQELDAAAGAQSPRPAVMGTGKGKADPALGDDAAPSAAAGEPAPVPESAAVLAFLPELPLPHPLRGSAHAFPPAPDDALSPSPALASALSPSPELASALSPSPELASALSPSPELASAFALPPAPASAPALASAGVGESLLTPAGPRKSALSAVIAPAAHEADGVAGDVRHARPAGTFTASTTVPAYSAAAAAADFAESGKSVPSAEGEIRREVAFVASLLDQHKSMPASAPGLHSGSAAPAAAAAASAPVTALEARVGERGWDQGLGDKLVWMAGHKQQVAELHLNPPDLGPLKIRLTLDHDQASAQFVCAHAAVREAIETAMPRLREMLADSGITLGNASVGTDGFHEQAQPQREPRAYSGAPAAADPGAVVRGERLLRSSHGLVDTFA